MALDEEAAGGEPLQVAGAVLDFIDAVALDAVEVVVVLLVRDLVAAGRARELDRAQPTLVAQPADVAVDGGDAEAGAAALGGGEHLFVAQRPAGVEQRLADGVALLGLSHSMTRGSWPRRTLLPSYSWR